jgi:HPt (histidine-containing phosphotransfer) domain-containing protein
MSESIFDDACLFPSSPCDPPTFLDFLDPDGVRRAERQLAAEIEALIGAGFGADPRTAAQRAHALLTPAMILGYVPLAAACRRFEAAVRNGTSGTDPWSSLAAEAACVLAALAGAVRPEPLGGNAR